MSVSRETGEPNPQVIAALFPDADLAIRRYVDLLTTDGVERGLIGPREAPRLWDRHILNCAVIREVFPERAHVADIGSGAGLPGLVLALSRRDVQVTLIEPLLRRATFLAEVIAELGLSNVTVLRARAEELAGKQDFDMVTARAVAPLARLAGWALPLCRAGGEVIALKGSSAHDELEDAKGVLESFRAGPATVEEFGLGMASAPTTVIRIQSSGQVKATRRGHR